MHFFFVLTLALASLSSTEATNSNASPKVQSPARSTSKVAATPQKQPQPTPTPVKTPPASPSPTIVKSNLGSASPSSSASPSICFYKAYVPTLDVGSEEEDLKRSIAGRIAIERRAFDRKPSRFGRCEFQSKLGKALDLRSNPTVDNVLTNINQAGGIPKWFRVKQDCSAAPGFEKVPLTASQVKATVKFTNPRTGKIIDKPTYNIDHIWELNFMQLFFGSILPTEKEEIPAMLTCEDFEKSFIIAGSKPAEQPIQQLYARIPQALIGKKSSINTLEFAGTSVELNAKKGRIFTPRAKDGTSLFSDGHRFTMRNTKDRIEALRTVGTVFDFMNDPAITTLFNRAQARLKAYLQEIDNRLLAGSVKLTRTDFKWATEFEKWMKKHLKISCDDSYDWVQSMTKQVQQEINQMPEKTAAQKADKVVLLTYLNTFKSSKYSRKGHYTLDWKA